MKIYLGERAVSADPGADRIEFSATLPAQRKLIVMSPDGRMQYTVTMRQLRQWAREHGKPRACPFAAE